MHLKQSLVTAKPCTLLVAIKLPEFSQTTFNGFSCPLRFLRWHSGDTFRFWKRCLLSAGPYRTHGSTQVHWKPGRRLVESSESLDPLYHGNFGLTRSREIKLRGGHTAGVVEPFLIINFARNLAGEPFNTLGKRRV
jgi:hypothetical protein